MESLCRVHVNWNNFRANIRLLKEKRKHLMPVIKADAYGHGVCQAARELEKSGMEMAAAGTLEEALLIRKSGFKGDIVALLTHFEGKDSVHAALEGNITVLIHCKEDLMLAQSALLDMPGEARLNAAFKFDSGMGRLGFALDHVEDAVQCLREAKKINPVLVLSHLAVADDPDEENYTSMQIDAFYKAVDIVRKSFPGVRCSLGNTADALLQRTHPEDICRPGLSLYGCNPFHGTKYAPLGEGFLPVMEAAAPIVSIHALRKGESLGYGRTYVAQSDRTVGWVAIGYADGYRRNPSSGTCMCIGGIRVPVIGRVAMQMTCVDLTDLPILPRPGDLAWILGGSGNAVSAQDLAGWWGTIPYEVLCLLGKNHRVDME